MLTSAQLQPASVAAVAMHGTGTPLGDPIEVGAVGQGLAGHASAGTRPVLLVSNKACFGHTEGTAGISGYPPLNYLGISCSGHCLHVSVRADDDACLRSESSAQ